MQEMQSRKRVETELRNAVEQLQNKCGVYESLLNKEEANKYVTFKRKLTGIEYPVMSKEFGVQTDEVIIEDK